MSLHDTHPHFVPNGDSRRDTAVLLTGTAAEFDIDQRDIRSTRSGFYISQRLYDVLTSESDERGDVDLSEPRNGLLPPDDVDVVLTGQVSIEPASGVSLLTGERVADGGIPESDINRKDAATRERVRIGAEVPPPALPGEDDDYEVRSGVAEHPLDPVEAETPVFVQEGVQTKVGPANAFADEDADEDDVEDDEDAESYDPTEDTVKGVKAYVEENPEHAATILAIETGEDGDSRPTLVPWLEAFIEAHPVEESEEDADDEDADREEQTLAEQIAEAEQAENVAPADETDDDL